MDHLFQDLYQVLGYSLFLGAIIGLVRITKIDTAYYPFIILLWLGSFNEVLSMVLIKRGYGTTLNNNIYVLLEAFLILWQFRRWDIFKEHSRFYVFLFFLLSLTWFLEYLEVFTTRGVYAYFRIVYSFIIVILSIQLNNKLILTYRKSLWRNASFIICSGFIIYFTYKILVEAFYLYGVFQNQSVAYVTYRLHGWLNFIVNILYALAILCIPNKPRFIRLSSLPG